MDNEEKLKVPEANRNIILKSGTYEGRCLILLKTAFDYFIIIEQYENESPSINLMTSDFQYAYLHYMNLKYMVRETKIKNEEEEK